MARKKPTRHEESSVVEEETPREEEPVAAEPSPPQSSSPTPSKAEMIREAIAALTLEAPNAALKSFIMDRYSVDVGDSNIYQLKNKMRGGTSLKEGASEGKRGNRGSPSTPSSSSLTVPDITALKQMGSRLGWTSLRELIDALED